MGVVAVGISLGGAFSTIAACFLCAGSCSLFCFCLRLSSRRTVMWCAPSPPTAARWNARRRACNTGSARRWNRGFSEIHLRDQAGDIIASGGVDERNSALLTMPVPADLPDGAYIVELRPAFASDGHVIAESRVFFVGEAVGGISGTATDDRAIPLEALWRAALNLANFLFFGSASLFALVLLPAWGNARYKEKLPPRVMRRLRSLVVGALLLAIAANIVSLVQQSMVFFNAGAAQVLAQNLWQVVLIGSRFGDVWTFRMVLLVFSAALLFAAALLPRALPRAGGWHLARIALAGRAFHRLEHGHQPRGRFAAAALAGHRCRLAACAGGGFLAGRFADLDADLADHAAAAGRRSATNCAAGCLESILASGHPAGFACAGQWRLQRAQLPDCAQRPGHQLWANAGHQAAAGRAGLAAGRLAQTIAASGHPGGESAPAAAGIVFSAGCARGGGLAERDSPARTSHATSRCGSAASHAASRRLPGHGCDFAGRTGRQHDRYRHPTRRPAS